MNRTLMIVALISTLSACVTPEGGPDGEPSNEPASASPLARAVPSGQDVSIKSPRAARAQALTPGSIEPETVSAGFQGVDAYVGRMNALVAEVFDHVDAARATVGMGAGSFAVTGLFSDTVTLGEGANEVVFTADGFNDSFVALFDHNGDLAWAKRAGGSDKDGAFAITRFSDDSVGLVGRFAGTVTFANPIQPPHRGDGPLT